jgi:hypothetical protein
VRLKKRFGGDLSKFPPCFFVKYGQAKARQKQHVKYASQSSTQQPVEHASESPKTKTNTPVRDRIIDLFDSEDDDEEPASSCNVNIGSPDSPLATTAHTSKLRRRAKPHAGACETSLNLPTDVQYQAWDIFSTVRASDIRQASGKTEHNAGELSAIGTSMMIQACGLTHEDVFVDIGSGIGNVVAQVALETSVKAAIGVEIRGDLARIGSDLIKRFQHQYKRLQAVCIHSADICAFNWKDFHDFQQATVLYCHNTLFKPEAQLVLEQLCCQLSRLKLVILQQPFCHRHRPTCGQVFCAIFRARLDPLIVPVTFTGSLSRLLVFERRIK